MRLPWPLLALACGGPERDPPAPPSWTPAADTAAPDPEPPAPLPLCVNEIGPAMARHADGADWVELFNPGDRPVSLQGWALGTTDAGLFPLAGEVPARGAHLLAGEELPVPLRRDGDELVLLAPDGRSQRLSWVAAPVDFAAARTIDCCAGPDCWGWTWGGSPGERNGGLLFGPTSRYAAVDGPPPPEWFDPAAPLPPQVSVGPPGGAGPVRSLVTTIAAVDDLTALELDLRGADGARVWLDGVEVARIGLPAGELAADAAPLGAGPVSWRRPLDPGALADGPVRLVAEVRAAAGRPSLELRLLARGPGAPGAVAPVQPSTSVEALPDPADPSAGVFASDRIHTVELFLSEPEIALLDLSTEEYVQAEVVLDGMPLDRVGIRRRGKYGSLRPMSGKPKLRLDFNRYVTGGEWSDLESLLLDNAVQDCAFVRMPLAYEVFRGAGNPAPRTGFARVFLNGEDYGQYYLTEEIDEIFAERGYGVRDAVIYDGSYANAVGEPLLLVDLDATGVPLYDQESGPDVGRADLQAAADLLDLWEAGQADWTAVGAALDWPSWHRHFAAEEWAGHVDGYLIMPNNYWLVAPDGRLRPVAWDVDQAFLEDEVWFSGARWETPAGRVGRLCRADPGCAAAWSAEVERLLAAVPGLDLPARLDRLEAITLAGTLADPKRECDEGSLFALRAEVRAWLEGRSETVAAGWGL